MSLHASHHREPPDRPPGDGPVPLWLALCGAGLAVWALGYLVFYNGGFHGNVYDETWNPRRGDFSADEASDPVAMGEKVYRMNCAVCHQPTGLGVPGQYPPLAGSELVLGQAGYGENHLARVVLNGLVEPVTIRGGVYNGAMSAWKEILDDAQVAAVLTYVRQAWGNQAGPIAPAQVAALRAEVGQRLEPWSEAQLKAIPAAPLPAPELLKAKAAPAPAPSGTQ